DGDDERDVGLDRGHDVADRAVLLAHQPEHAVARLRQGRERLEGLEGGRQATTVAFGGLTCRGGGGALSVGNRLECSVCAHVCGLPWLRSGGAVRGLRATGQIIGSGFPRVECRVPFGERDWCLDPNPPGGPHYPISVS